MLREGSDWQDCERESEIQRWVQIESQIQVQIESPVVASSAA